MIRDFSYIIKDLLQTPIKVTQIISKPNELPLHPFQN
jgi:hypothetical protein